MSVEGSVLLERLAGRYRMRRLAALAALAFGAGILACGVARALGGSWGPAAVAALAALAATGIAAVVRYRAELVDAATVARHLDRTCPGAEESTELLLLPAAELALGGRLQRARAERALDRADLELPDRLARRSVVATLLVTATGAALLAVPYPGAMPGTTSGPAAAAPTAPQGKPRIRGAEVRVEPPRYTRRPVRTGRDWEIEAEEGATVTWTVDVDRAVASFRIITTAGDTVHGVRAAASSYRVSLVARRSALYQPVVIDGADTVAGDFHRLGVTPDGVPTLVIVRPDQRTEVARGDPAVIELEALASDDHAIAAAAIVATVTTGEGEGVRFREQRLEFDRRSARPGGLTLRRSLDLKALGMAPGDELYLYVVARDNRAPTPGEGRSETVFISLADSAGVATTLPAGVAIRVAPEYFRSQRQIIIDTEKLIAERRSLPLQVFRDRGNNIGIDQGLLRLRYGQFTGEEFEEGGADDAGHEHDVAENSTLLAASVKTKLKAAIAEMWEAELRLRTYRPSEALPFEYRALELLKQVQQDARVYVERVGFEPPPLEPDRKRLTGKLDAIRDRRVVDSVIREPSLPAIRTALATVRAVARGRNARADDALDVERAGAELAALAVEDPARHLSGIRDLRALSDSLRTGTRCTSCLARAERALLRALPEPPRPAAARQLGSPLARRYFERLERTR